MPWVRCAFGNVYVSNHDIRDGQVTVCCYCNTMISVVVLCCWQANEEASQCIVLSVVMFCKHSSDGGLSKDGRQPDAYFFGRRDIKGIFPVHIILNSTEHEFLVPSLNVNCGFEVELELLRVSSGLLLKTIPSSELKIVWHPLL